MTMRTVVLQEPTRFSLIETPEPVPVPGEALVRIHRLGICGTDLHAFAGRQPFFTYPRILGHELGVEVVDPGTDPHGLKAGDRCSVEPYMNCGACHACRRGLPNCCANLKVIGVHADGGMRPLLAIPARKLHRSDKLDFDQLALVETLGIGAHAVERSGAGAGDYVAVVGAGPIGMGVIQFARALQARVVVVDTSEARLEFCRTHLGVTHTLNPQQADMKASLLEIGGGDPPSIVFDATGNRGSMQASFEMPGHGGRLVFVGLVQGDLIFNDPSFHRRELTVFASRNALPDTFRSIIAMIEAGRIDTSPWITHRFPLDEVPARFPGLAQDPSLIKAVVHVATS